MERVLGGVDLKRFCRRYFDASYPNDWGLFRNAEKALRIAKSNPSEENIKQAFIVREGFRSSVDMYLQLFIWATKGLPHVLIRRISDSIRGRPPVSAGMLGYEWIEWPPSASRSDNAEGEIY